jgi:hypothetical protein
MTLKRTLAGTFGTAILAVALSAGASFAASDYVGKYKTEDTQGKPMQITLSEDGTATGQRGDESLAGKWKENEKGAAVIRWEDGWVTKLSKKGEGYTKLGFEKGKRDEAKKAKAEKTE